MILKNPFFIILISGFNTYLPSGLFHPDQLDESISKLGVSGELFFHFTSNRNSCLIANSVDPDQTPHSSAYNLGLHCLPRSQNWHPGHEWVNLNWIPPR